MTSTDLDDYVLVVDPSANIMDKHLNNDNWGTSLIYMLNQIRDFYSSVILVSVLKSSNIDFPYNFTRLFTLVVIVFIQEIFSHKYNVVRIHVN